MTGGYPVRAVNDADDWVWFSEGDRASLEPLREMLARGGVEGRIVAPKDCNTST